MKRTLEESDHINEDERNKNTSIFRLIDAIEKSVEGYGANDFSYIDNKEEIRISFKLNSRVICYSVPMPDRRDFLKTATGKTRMKSVVDRAYENACSHNLKILNQLITAKLQAVKDGLSGFEEEFSKRTNC